MIPYFQSNIPWWAVLFRKGFVVKNPMGADSTRLRIVNSDDVYEKLASLAKPEPLDPKDPSCCKSQGQEAREKAKRITQARQGNYLDGRLGLITMVQPKT